VHGAEYATLSIKITDVLLPRAGNYMQPPVSRARGVTLIVGCVPLRWRCSHRACRSAWICCIQMRATVGGSAIALIWLL